jgi:hypothetical protein
MGSSKISISLHKIRFVERIECNMRCTNYRAQRSTGDILRYAAESDDPDILGRTSDCQWFHGTFTKDLHASSEKDHEGGCLATHFNAESPERSRGF